MILRLNKKLYLILNLFVILYFSVGFVSGQDYHPASLSLLPKIFSIKQDTAKEKQVLTVAPDTNFTWQKYASFLKKISDTSKYVVLPLNEFRQTLNSKKIVIGLRHDIDLDLKVAYEFSKIEYDLGFRSTYFILHTAPYYLADQNNMALHSEKIIPILKKMQNERHFEIGWHNDLVTLQVIYNFDPVVFLHNELSWLRSNGLQIAGTAAHGSNYCKTYHYMNFYFFQECSYPILVGRENNITVPKDGKMITLKKGHLNDFNLEYEAYFLNNNKAYSDAVIKDGVRWNIGMLDLSSLKPGDRIIILLHPIHWHKASENAKFEKFSIIGQKTSYIDSINYRIAVEMPNGTDLSSLKPSFQLSTGAYAKVSRILQISNKTVNNFNNPVIYTVVAENRDIKKEWTVEVFNSKPYQSIVSSGLPGLVEPPKPQPPDKITLKKQ
jgi:hypothetical protein